MIEMGEESLATTRRRNGEKIEKRGGHMGKNPTVQRQILNTEPTELKKEGWAKGKHV